MNDCNPWRMWRACFVQDDAIYLFKTREQAEAMLGECQGEFYEVEVVRCSSPSPENPITTTSGNTNVKRLLQSMCSALEEPEDWDVPGLLSEARSLMKDI